MTHQYFQLHSPPVFNTIPVLYNYISVEIIYCSSKWFHLDNIPSDHTAFKHSDKITLLNAKALIAEAAGYRLAISSL